MTRLLDERLHPATGVRIVYAACAVANFPPGTNLQVSGAVLRFRDAAGTKWEHRPGGYLGGQQP